MRKSFRSENILTVTFGQRDRDVAFYDSIRRHFDRRRLAMREQTKTKRVLMSGAMVLGLSAATASAFPDEKEQDRDRSSDLGAVLEKLPPEVREKLIVEIERLKIEAERLKKEAMAKGEEIKRDAMKVVEEVKRDAQVRMERAEAEVRRQMESVERTRRESAEARHHAEHAHEEGDHAAHAEAKDKDKKARTTERRVHVDVRKEGEGKAVMRVFEDGKEVTVKEIPADMFIEGSQKIALLREMDLSKLPPEKRAAIEKARAELKEAEARMRAAAETLAKAEGRERSEVMIFRGQNMPSMDLRSFTGDRVPGVPLPPGAGRADRMPRPPVPPIPPQPPATPELEKRVSKAEKALDEILSELQKLRELGEKDDDDDDDDDEKDKGKKKK
jgi:hypothetical protein